jgi:hypothetical protein
LNMRLHKHTTLAIDLRKLLRIGALALLLALPFIHFSVGARSAAPAEPLPAFRIDPDLPDDIVLNAGQGLGQCHWVDEQILSEPLVSWAYDASMASSAWKALEPRDGTFDWAPLDAQVAKARSLGKQIWLELLTTEGGTPQWAKDAGVRVVGSRGGTPIPWNSTYQQLLRRAIHTMAARYDDDPTVDAINIMAGGCYGEMSICAPQTDRRAWEQAGYTDEQFIQSVKQLLDIYLEDEYTWEDGTKTHGFLRTPVVLQLGSGLYGHTTAVISPVVEYAMSKYGMRVWLKFNGWGDNYDMGWLYQEYAAMTKVGYEPAGNSMDFSNRPEVYMREALDQHASFICMQGTYFGLARPEWQEARQMAARYLGAQIVHQGTEAPASVVPGQEYTFITNWVNRGTAPLMRPERQGLKDVPASYEIVLAFVDANSGESVLEHSFTPHVPTTAWYSALSVRIEETIDIAASLPAGQYDLRIALVDPSPFTQDEHRHFRLINADLSDGSGRYTVGQITVVQPSSPTLTPSPEPTPMPVDGGNWGLRSLRDLWDWLRRLLLRLRYFASGAPGSRDRCL